MNKRNLLLMVGLCFVSAVIGGVIAVRLADSLAFARDRVSAVSKVGAELPDAKVGASRIANTFGTGNELPDVSGKGEKAWIEGTKGWDLSTNALFNLGGGRVGVGTTNPQALFHVGGTSGTDGIMFPDGTKQTTAFMVLTSQTAAQSGSNSCSITLPTGTWVLVVEGFTHQTSWTPITLTIAGVVVQTTKNIGDQAGTGYTVMMGTRTVTGGTWTASLAGDWGGTGIFMIAFRISP